MGTLLKDSDRCRFCAFQVSELKFGLYSDLLTVLQTDPPDSQSAISFTKAAKDLLNLNLDAKSGFSQISCHSCKISLENFSNFLNKVNVGQTNLLEIMKSEGTIEVKKKGRPRKGFEKNSPNTNKESLLIASKRPKKTTKKFEEFENSQKTEAETTKVSSIMNQISGEVRGGTLGVFNCEACNKVFRLQEDLDSHISSSHGQIMYKCERCASTLRNKEDLKAHQASTGHEDFIILEIAGVGGPDDKLQRAKLKEKVGCKQCDLEFDTPEQLSSHSRDEHGGGKEVKTFSCEEETCARQFSSSNSLAYHRSTAHQAASHHCPETDCEKLFKTKSLLSRHLKTHNSERAYSCDKCDKSFKTRSNLYSHLNVHTESKFFCEECGQQFKHRTSLASHRRWHQGDRPFKCPFCTKTFNQKGNLQEHIRIHTGDKPFKCDLCPRAFTTSSQHRLHVKRHLGVKQFKCELCSKCFLNKDTYNTHLRRHKGEKPFSCKICKKSFAESWALTKHLRCHTGHQPYLCKECGKRFADSSNLAKHKKTHEDSSGKTKPTVWNIVKNVGEEMTNITEAAVTEVEEEGEQVIYITYENEDQRQTSDTLAAESAEYVEVGEGNQQIQLTTKEGAQISLAFTSEYFKEIPQ